MPYQYEYDKALKVYSITIDLDMIGKDENFKVEADNNEKAHRVNAILDAIENLTLTVKGNLDNAEPVFVVGLSNRKTHYFENVVKVENEKLILSDDLKEKISSEYSVALLKSNVFNNQAEIIKELQPKSIVTFFNELKSEVKSYYGV